MIVGSGVQSGPQYICDRCNWSDDWCTCRKGRGRNLRHPGDVVDQEWQRERRYTMARNRARDPNRNTYTESRVRQYPRRAS